MSDEMRRRATGIVLAGGRASRFGSDKLSEPIGGRPLLLAAVETMASVAREVVVVLAPDAAAPAIPASLAPVVSFARDRERHGGPLVAILAGLEAASEPLALVAGGDMPWLRDSVLRLLLDEAERQSVAAAALSLAGRRQQLPIALRVEEARLVARRLVGDGARRIDDLLDELRARAVDESTWRELDPDALTLRDVDRPGDLAGPGGPNLQ